MTAPKAKGEKEMANIVCPICKVKGRSSSIALECTPEAKMTGIVQCLVCGHEIPITLENSYIQKLDIALPGAQSDKFGDSVPNDIKEDVKEAERANYHQCYKACATMCRRALQLGLIDKGVKDEALNRMLKNALGNNLLNQEMYSLATSIKGFGDIGAHRREQLESQEVNMLIYATVRMLNELFEKPDKE